MAFPKNCKEIEDQTRVEKMYLLKLIATQILGDKWAYYRKIKHGKKGLSFLKEPNLMEQMKATQSALKFTSKNAAKSYRTIYAQTLKEISKYCGIKEGFPDLPEELGHEDETPVPSLEAEHDAEIISWTPIKFFLPAKSIRAKGGATQRHTEGLIAKLYFKVLGFYIDPENWDKAKLTLYLRNIKKDSTHAEIVSELEPLQKDLHELTESYDLFKFGKASLAKDASQDDDAYDDAMGVESLDYQIKTLYWYDFIYAAMEIFIYRYFLTLVTGTASFEAMNHLMVIFKPAFRKIIENRNIFLGSFETDRSKQVLRKHYLKYKEKRRGNLPTKLLKTKQGIFRTYFFNENLLNRFAIDFDVSQFPNKNSQWWWFCKHYILGIDRRSQSLINIEELSDEIQYSKDLAAGKQVAGPLGKLQEREKKLHIKTKKLKEKFLRLENEKKILDEKTDLHEGHAPLTYEERVGVEEGKKQLMRLEFKLEKEKKSLKREYEKIEKKKEKFVSKKRLSRSELEEKEALLKNIADEEAELNELEIRESAFIHVIAMLIKTTQYKRRAKHNILERFKKRVELDKELVEKRILEMKKKMEKRIREMTRKADKLKRLKQDDAYDVILSDIEKTKKSAGERFISIRVDAKTALLKQRKRLQRLFHSISQETEVSEANASHLILKLTNLIEPDATFSQDFSKFVMSDLKKRYVKELEPFYKNMFNILEVSLDEKRSLIQALDKAGGSDGIKLSLSTQEEEHYSDMLGKLKKDAEEQFPNLFQSKVFCMTDVIVLENLLKLNIDNKTLKKFLLMKIVSPNTNKPVKLNSEAAGNLLELNKIMNPIPKYNLLVEGRENEKDPQKSINTNLLHKLLGK